MPLSIDQALIPWRATPYNSIVGCGVVGLRGIVIATIPGPKEHAEPIARLIAAAPDLLAALRQAIEGTEDTPAASDSALAQARAAIAKAEGRS